MSIENPKSETTTYIPRVVKQKTRDGTVHDIVEVTGRFSGPTYAHENGAWLVELCEELTPEEETDYWVSECKEARERAESAMGQIRALQADLIHAQRELIDARQWRLNLLEGQGKDEADHEP